MNRHGWVTPLPFGAKARCGGPGMCKVCQAERAATTRVPDRIDSARQHEDAANPIQEVPTDTHADMAAKRGDGSEHTRPRPDSQPTTDNEKAPARG